MAQRTLAIVERAFASKVDVDTSMQTLLSACAEERPHLDWKRLAALDYAAGAESVRVWIERALADETPPANVDGLWFGLFTPVYDGEPQVDLHLHAAKFDANDDDWPCTPQWQPKDRYAHSSFCETSTGSPTATAQKGLAWMRSIPRFSDSLRCR